MPCQFKGQDKAKTYRADLLQGMTMKQKNRFLDSAVKTAHDSSVEMPWARGKRRAAFIAKRQEQENVLRRSA